MKLPLQLYDLIGVIVPGLVAVELIRIDYVLFNSNSVNFEPQQLSASLIVSAFIAGHILQALTKWIEQSNIFDPIRRSGPRFHDKRRSQKNFGALFDIAFAKTFGENLETLSEIEKKDLIMGLSIEKTNQRTIFLSLSDFLTGLSFLCALQGLVLFGYSILRATRQGVFSESALLVIFGSACCIMIGMMLLWRSRYFSLLAKEALEAAFIAWYVEMEMKNKSLDADRLTPEDKMKFEL